MLKKIIISISILSLIGISQANEFKPEKLDIPLRLNAKNHEKFSTQNIVYDEIIQDYLKDFGKRYKKLESNLEQIDRQKEMSLKTVNQKFDHMKKEQERNKSVSVERDQAKVNEIVKNSKTKEEIQRSINGMRTPERTTDLEKRKSLLKENERTILKVFENHFKKQTDTINQTFEKEQEIFVNIFRNKMKEFTVNSDEKAFLDESIKETLAAIKGNAININKDISDDRVKMLRDEIYLFEIDNEVVKAELKNQLEIFDKAIYDVRWKYSRSKTVYPQKIY